ncbi:MAG: hypothetical protein R2710_11525 [Acidimicrobiales bacterium]
MEFIDERFDVAPDDVLTFGRNASVVIDGERTSTCIGSSARSSITGAAGGCATTVRRSISGSTMPTADQAGSRPGRSRTARRQRWDRSVPSRRLELRTRVPPPMTR